MGRKTWKRWTKEDETLLRSLLSDSGCTYTEIAQCMKRTKTAVALHVQALKLQQRPATGRRHDVDLRVTYMRLVELGMGIPQIAAHVNKHHSTVRKILLLMVEEELLEVTRGPYRTCPLVFTVRRDDGSSS